ncbi:MAG: glycerol-3-phosphate dehydrogenase/oxidase [Cytophagaceae bacterium]|nr:glycerol-3-phosphate dehydrogenase/oxidase [Cytophagaceae bacterium]MDW8455888.1 glycerol-3-phosphate dehydrogenase/oxidase [Cytophagaceae bacterium]
MKFDLSYRDKELSRITTKKNELIVIGGGITGAGIALDASSRGIQTVLLEKRDLASGTSGRSTKLIHGGLRYLRQLEFGLVKETGRERAILHKMAPTLVKPEPMLLPILKNGTLSLFEAIIGTWLYDTLAGVKKNERRKMLLKGSVRALEPALREDWIRSGIYYYEYQTDDARLTMEIAREAAYRNASVITYAKVKGFLFDSSKKIIGVCVDDLLNGKSYEIKADVVVNATGHWTDITSRLNNLNSNIVLKKTKGIHIVVDAANLPIGQAIYTEALDRRMIFFIPKRGKVYIGTTDTDYYGDPDNPDITERDIDYLLSSANALFPSYKLKRTDVESGWAGIRPLVFKKETINNSTISRKDEIYLDKNSGLISIAGGKLTGFRKMAERITNIVEMKIKNRTTKCGTHNVLLHSSKTENNLPLNDYLYNCSNELVNRGFTRFTADDIVARYGTATKNIISGYDNMQHCNNSELRLLLAEYEYCKQHELCIFPSDFFMQRTGYIYFDIKKVNLYYTHVYEYEKKINNIHSTLIDSDYTLTTAILNSWIHK